MPRPYTICRNKTCKRPYHEHDGRACPNGKTVWRKHDWGTPGYVKVRASTSLSPHEVHFLDELTRMVARGGDTRLFARTQAKVLGRLQSKVAKMRATIDALRSPVVGSSGATAANGSHADPLVAGAVDAGRLSS